MLPSLYTVKVKYIVVFIYNINFYNIKFTYYTREIELQYIIMQCN